MDSLMSFKIYIVDDDEWYRSMLEYNLKINPDYEIVVFKTAKEILAQLYLNPDLVCMDFGLPDMKGEKLLEEMLKYHPNLPVVVISGQEDIAVAVDLLKIGARDYIVKDDHTKDILWKSIINIRENLSLKREVETLKTQIEHKYEFQNSIIGQSKAIKQSFELLQKAVQSNINVSLSGETGTGKEVYAKAIHFNSPRRKKTFVAINMGAIPKELVESELFGYEKGAFTGANSTKIGKIEEANGGTLFLDEIAELDITIQSKLLRVLQEREIVRIGGTKPIPIDFRLITATHKSLADEVKNELFREDLFYRIVGLNIELPPLRNRENDVLILAKHFIDDYAKENKIKAPSISESAKSKLKNYPFPGNVRELKAAIDLAIVMSNGIEILDSDISFYQLRNEMTVYSGDKTLRQYEIDLITAYLKNNQNNVLLVAEKLDIAKSKIYNLIKNEDIKI